jgi:tetrahydromethanopterin S-methyltransferase subunit B
MTRCWRLDQVSYAAITQLDQARTRFIAVSEKFAARGLDVEPINNQLTELGDALKKSRTYVHSFSRNTFQQAAAPGEEAVKRTDALVNKATEEFKYRQIGLVVSIGFIGLLMLAIYLKLRQMEK